MNHKKLKLCTLLFLGLTFGIGNYSSAQNIVDRYNPKSESGSDDYPIIRNLVKGNVIQANPAHFIAKGDTIYICYTHKDHPINNLQQFVYEFIAKPQDKLIIELLLEAQIKELEHEQKRVFVELAEDFNGNIMKTNYLQIAGADRNDLTYVFEAANK